jgi:hypothetical protein
MMYGMASRDESVTQTAGGKFGSAATNTSYQPLKAAAARCQRSCRHQTSTTTVGNISARKKSTSGTASPRQSERRRFALMTEATRDVLRRAAPIDEVVRAAAHVDPGIAEMQREHDQRRLNDVRLLVGLLAESGPLRMAPDDAADVMWALSRSTDISRALTSDRRWTH